MATIGAIPLLLLEGREIIIGVTVWYLSVLVMIGNGTTVVKNFWKIKHKIQK